jgi:hypothetical protein
MKIKQYSGFDGVIVSATSFPPPAIVRLHPWDGSEGFDTFEG